MNTQLKEITTISEVIAKKKGTLVLNCWQRLLSLIYHACTINREELAAHLNWF